MLLTPEQRAREEIDGQLEACGWTVQDFASMDIHTGRGVAVREYPLKWKEGAEIKSGFADYVLYADARVLRPDGPPGRVDRLGEPAWRGVRPLAEEADAAR